MASQVAASNERQPIGLKAYMTELRTKKEKEENQA
jgi:hypothetical protein